MEQVVLDQINKALATVYQSLNNLVVVTTDENLGNLLNAKTNLREVSKLINEPPKEK
jgi:hypothetical protein